MRTVSSILFVLSMICVNVSCKRNTSDIDAPTPPLPDIATKNGQILLPAGSNYNLTGSSIMMLGYTMSVSSDGKVNLVDTKTESAIAWLFDKDNNPVMAAFITDSTNSISTATTAKVLLYYASGLTFSSDTLRTAFINNINGNTHVNEWVSTFTESWKSDPQIITKGNFVASLQKTIKAIIGPSGIQSVTAGKKADIPGKADTKLASLFINETGFRSGIQFFEKELGQLSAYNQYRRRTHAFLYKKSYKDNNEVSHDILTSIESNTKADKDFAISPASANTSLTGQLGAMIEGKLEEIAQSELSSPITFTLTENESEVTYKVHVVGPGVQSNKPVTTDEIAKQTRLEVETFAIDFVFPIIMEVFGWSDDLNKSGINIGSGKTEDFINKVDVFLKAAPDVYEEIKNGNYYMASRKTIELLITGSLDKFLEPIATAAVVLVYDAGTKIKKTNVPLEKLFADADKVVGNLKKAAKILQIVNVAMLAHDLSRITQAFLNSRQMEEWTIVAKTAKVTLLPDSSAVTAGQEQELQVEIKNMQETGGDKHPFFEWSTTGKYGKLKDSKGHSGNSFATADHQVIFESSSTAALSNGNNIDYIYVKVMMGSAVIGYDTAIVNVQKSKYVLKPKNYTLTGKNDPQGKIKYDNELRLFIENVNGRVDIKPNDTIDYKIVWTTAGSYGKLHGKGTGPATSLTTFNDHEIWYRCTDDKTKKAVETITAKIYAKKQGTSDDAYVLREELKETVNIENEDKKYIIKAPLEYLHGDTTSGDPRYRVCYWSCAATFDEDKNAERYEVVFVIDEPFGGIYRGYSWNAGSPPPNSLPHYVRPPYINNRFCVSYGNSGGTRLPGEHITLSGDLASGFAQITIYLK